ncbi:MAG: DNA-3-methyladenine glycosylase I [Gilliamella sp.]|nr:DNA-3-methyladenine glycosylase I [Gilliamella sp.]MCO6557755.1 DNA-3-methyladenine glycosylase I [Gilliamella sp.]
MTNEIKRCDWATKSQIEQDYHDREWGIPVHDDYQLVKMLVLEVNKPVLAGQQF